MPATKKTKWHVVDNNGEIDEFEAERVEKEGRSATFFNGDVIVADYANYNKIVPVSE